jgi:hypothetical protein
MSNILMKPQKSEKIQVNFLIPKELNEVFRTFVQEKYGLYRHGIFAEVFAKSLRQFIETEGKQ